MSAIHLLKEKGGIIRRKCHYYDLEDYFASDNTLPPCIDYGYDSSLLPRSLAKNTMVILEWDMEGDELFSSYSVTEYGTNRTEFCIKICDVLGNDWQHITI